MTFQVRSTMTSLLWFVCSLLGSDLTVWAQCNPEQKAAQHRMCDKACREAFTAGKKYVLCMKDCESRCGLPDGGTTGGTSPTGVLPYDLVWKQEDLNGLPLNPHWWKQDQPTDPGLPSQKECSTPWDSNCTRDNPTIVPLTFSFPDPIEPFCATSGPSGHHVNWATVTYTGTALWDELDFWDDDVNINVQSKDDSAYTAQNPNAMHTESSSDETIKRFSTQWWSQFRDGLGNEPRDATIGTGEVIEIGVLGLDCAHSCGSEIHPVYAMAVHVKDDPQDDTWAIFGRNWGDEGFCGQVDLPEPLLNRIFLNLGWRGRTLPTSVPKVKATTTWEKPFFAGNEVQVKTFPLFQGVRPTAFVVEIDLGDPSKGNFVDGELHLQWPGVGPATSATPGPTTQPLGPGPGALAGHRTATTSVVATGESPATPGPEKRFEQFVAGLPADVRRQVANARTEQPAPPRMVAFSSLSLNHAPVDFRPRSVGASRPGGPPPMRQTPNKHRRDLNQKLDKIFRDNNIKAPSH